MSHAWSGFGLLFIATILHTTALSFKLDRTPRAAVEGALRNELIGSVAECIFVWVALVSALRVVVSPTRGSLPECTLMEDLSSTASLVVWASIVVLDKVQRGKVSLDTEELQASKTYLISVPAFVLAVGAILEIVSAYPLSGRIGMVCFFEGLWVHVFLQIWFFRKFLIEVRYTIRESQSTEEKSMERIAEEETLSIFSHEMFKLGRLVILSSASLGVVIAVLTLGDRIAGGIVFWELWLTFTGIKTLREELARPETISH
jgi:hypothetical protein